MTKDEFARLEAKLDRWPPEGRVHAALLHLVGESAGEEVARHFSIRPSMPFHEERRFVESTLGGYELAEDGWTRAVKAEPKRALRAAWMLTGLYWNEQRLRPAPPRVPEAALAAGPVALCLVVPSARLAPSLALGMEVAVPEAVRLLDECRYFRAILPDDAKQAEGELHLDDDWFPDGSGQDAYLRLSVDPGQSLLDASTPYALRNRLTDGDPAIRLERRALLKHIGDEPFLKRR